MAYLTIKETGNGLYEEKKSKFYSISKRVENEQQADEFINSVKAANKEARHNCFAYVIGENKIIQKCSDDGEPQKTAGIPILDVINLNKLTDVCIVVTRYFGGILLGASGLTRAYKKAASLSILEENKIEKVPALEINLIFSYELLGKLQYFLKEDKIDIMETKYTDKVLIKLNLEEKIYNYFENKIKEICNGKIEINKGETEYYFKSGFKLFKDFT
ncbi:MAG: YigZ family protein [Bacillota bacterium]|nr:YigZ family protein [Bacillota bacterium]